MTMGANKKRSDWVWERQWAPHDEPTYWMVLEYARPHDVILEIGAGDFRLSRRLAAKSRFVYGLEISPILVTFAKAEPKIDNLRIILGDAYNHPLPKDITLAVLMMRHCQGFGLLADKLVSTGCTRLQIMRVFY
jgi:16S rRNA A1518/A1519 N6-dimethyltransferase RsmA/KsgA/DIM1 with predicted DNA glycosylase/AP lyase activity